MSNRLRPAAARQGRASSVIAAIALGALLLFAGALWSSPAQAAIAITSFDGETLEADGSPSIQAGAHPFSQSTTISFAQKEDPEFPGSLIPEQSVKDIEVDLPAGFIGNPTSLPQCTEVVITRCPNDSAVGQVSLVLAGNRNAVPVYNLAPPPGMPAQFGFFVVGVTAKLDVRVRTEGDYGVTVTIPNISQALPLSSTTLTLWGEPGLSAHDNQRGECAVVTGVCPANGLKLPFLTNPVSCTRMPLTTSVRADSWQDPGDYSSASFTSHDNLAPVSPVRETGCDHVGFAPAFSMTPETTRTDAPTGQTVELKVPQNNAQGGLGTGDLREAVVSVPQGVTLNPGAADGLQGCGDAQIAIHSATPGSCPGASVVGTVKVTTPLLSSPLEGQVFVGAPECSPCNEEDARSGRLLRLFIQAEGSGVVIKAVGTVSADPVTGQLTVTFKELPQQPFSDLVLTLKGGERGVFINPLRCGQATLTSSLTPWSGTQSASPSASFNADWDGAGGACPATLPFSPSFSAGNAGAQGGAFSTFTTTFSRPDRNQILNGVSVRMPAGLLGMLSSIPLCGEPQAAQGSCSASSRIATATVAAGTGLHPFWFSGPVYLTSGYKGAPFGLSIAVPAVAGPFNLGTVVTRAAINVDPHTAQVTITSDPFPQIIDGIKTHIQTVNVTADRPGFTFNPTSCTATSVGATITSTEGASAAVSSPFQAANCANLPYKPKLSAATGGHASKASGASLDVKVASKGGPQPSGGEANIRSVKVSLPKQLPSRLTTLQKACVAAVFEANPASCPTASNVGTGTATTPVLAHPLSGPAYLVSHGGAAFPDLQIVLQGEGITLVLDGKTDIKKGVTTSTFDSVPDAPISAFELKLPTGKYSVLGANLPVAAKYNLCGKTLTMPTTITGQNGAVVKQTTKVAISGCPKVKTKATKRKAKKAGRARRARHGKRGKA
jgi:hypothetical protein